MERTDFPAPLQGLRHYPTRATCVDRSGRIRPDIFLLVPADRTGVEASSRDATGKRNRISVSAPCIAFVPATAQLAAPRDDPQGIVITLDLQTLKSKLRQVFGSAARELPLWFQAWDPFLRAAADTLMSLSQTAAVDAGCLESFADAIALHVSYHYSRNARASDPEVPIDQQKLARINIYIAEHIAENIQVEHLAALVHMSQSHFARAFKKVTGSPPHFHLTTERLRLAKWMLSSSQVPLVDVAARVGFQTQQHFTEVFHRYTGMTPRAFRLAARSELPEFGKRTPGSQNPDTSSQE
ncbi:AraC family transcriptional regulator [Paraburkholderia edwinii]|uniref:AraC family transcriptional regulator n=1 Tax=Paraburkholderia edwinii TaxID=2861782 RepID=A0ABX8UE85_9BURK|nr:AraC family transcriptional regulator [Paraburkholderia edwinii]QYD67020.1 AraC family transcriptional regulator [Paraburkholderia edwinii]